MNLSQWTGCGTRYRVGSASTSLQISLSSIRCWPPRGGDIDGGVAVFVVVDVVEVEDVVAVVVIVVVLVVVVVVVIVVVLVVVVVVVVVVDAGVVAVLYCIV